MFCKNGTAEKKELLEGVQMSTLVHGEKTLMGHFNLTKGAAIPPHSHPHEQTGFMVSGKMRFKIEDEVIEAVTGDSWCIPGEVEHSVEALEESVVIEVFSPVREDYLPLTASL
ncbi:MAG: cupin domain-containing protein [Desulfobacteraceae bacterium]|nr:cupin domain-containing protein [Desulfobacteraceae bacterium]